MNSEVAKNLILEMIANFGIALLTICGTVIVLGVAMLIYNVGKNLVYRGAFGATIDHIIKPKWKGYKWYRSKKWNLEHTA